MDIITTIVWLIGVVVVIYPIYAAILRAETRARTGAIATPVVAFLATLAALLWPLAVPFLASYYMHTGRTFKAEIDRVEAREQVANVKLALASQTAAAAAVEVSAKEIETEVSKARKKARLDELTTLSPRELDTLYYSASYGSEDRELINEAISILRRRRQ